MQKNSLELPFKLFSEYFNILYSDCKKLYRDWRINRIKTIKLKLYKETRT